MKKTKYKWKGIRFAFLLLMVFSFSLLAFSQDIDKIEARNNAIISLEKKVNVKIGKVKPKAPLSYQDVWAHNILEKDLSSLMQTHLEAYNDFTLIQNDYKDELKKIEEEYGDPELEHIDKEVEQKNTLFYAELEKDIVRNIGPTTRGRFPEEMKPENFMKTKFEEIPYFVRNRTVLNAITNLKEKHGPQYEEGFLKAEQSKEAIIAKRKEESRQRSLDFAAGYKEEKEKEGSKSKKEYGFMDDFWLGIKFGLNYGTGSEGGGKTADGLFGVPIFGTLGISFEYILLRAEAIAFEMSLMLDINYIQKPVAIAEGTVNSDYINIPVFAIGKFPAHIPLGFGDLSPFIGVGIDPYLRLSSNFVYGDTGKAYVFDTRGFSIGFVWNIGAELNLFGLGSVSLEFRMALGGSSGIAAFPLIGVPTAEGTFADFVVPEQRQNGYMVLLAWKMPLSNIFFMF